MSLESGHVMSHTSFTQATIGMTTHPCWLLMCGIDPTLLTTRVKVLETAGYEVECVSNVDDAQRLMTSHHHEYALLMLCHTVPPDMREVLHGMAHKAQLHVYQVEKLMNPKDLLQEVSSRCGSRE